MDKNKKRPNDPHYDPSTIFIPEKSYKEMPAAMQQYWYYKRDNYDKIICFKLGKFFEIFEEDALICHKLLDLNFMGVNKLHVGFPASTLMKNCQRLVD
jgi:DNA mismatch repair protein MSH6